MGKVRKHKIQNMGGLHKEMELSICQVLLSSPTPGMLDQLQYIIPWALEIAHLLKAVPQEALNSLFKTLFHMPKGHKFQIISGYCIVD